MSILKVLFSAAKEGGEAAVRQLLRNTPPQVRQRAQQTLQRAVGGSSGRQLPPTNIRPSAPAPRPDPGWAQSKGRPAPVPDAGWAGGGGRRGSAPPTPTVPEPFIPRGATVYQPNLPSPRGPRGQFQSIYGEPSAVIQSRQRMAVPVDPGVTRGPAVSPGQLAIDSLGYDVPTGPLGANLLKQDPGTYQSVSDLARRASETYGRTFTVEDLLGAQTLPSRLLNAAPRGSLTVSPVPSSASTRQLSFLREGEGSGFVKLRNPAGTVDPATGRGMGGQVFDPNVPVVPRQGPGLSSGYIPTRGGGPMKIGPVQDLSLDEAIQRGLVTTNVPGRAPSLPVNFGRQSFTAPTIEAAQTAVRNAVGGTRKMNLSELAGITGLAAAGGLGIGTVLYNMLGGGGASNADQPNIPLPPNLRDTSAYDPLLEAERTGRLPVTEAGSATGGVTGQTGPAVIRTNDAASAQRQAAANAIAATLLRPDSPGAYSNVGGYYQARNAYAAQPGVVGNIVEQLIQVDPRFDRAELQAWAAANPGLAYEMLNNQQMPNLQQPEITTELGSNTPNNAIGNSEEQARVVLEGADPALRDATRPRMAVSLQNPFYARPGFAATGRF